MEVRALQEISFRVEDGAFVGIMGHTGCGKSTLIQLIAGLLSPGEGRILIDGVDINGSGYDREDLRRRLGIVFQYPESQLFEATVEKDVAFALKHSGLSPGGCGIRNRGSWRKRAYFQDAGNRPQISAVPVRRRETPGGDSRGTGSQAADSAV